MKPIEGEPAFPNGPYDGFPACYGLSERRWYIGQALMGICANPNSNTWNHKRTATEAIKIADAVMQLLYPQQKETDQ